MMVVKFPQPWLTEMRICLRKQQGGNNLEPCKLASLRSLGSMS